MRLSFFCYTTSVVVKLKKIKLYNLRTTTIQLLKIFCHLIPLNIWPTSIVDIIRIFRLCPTGSCMYILFDCMHAVIPSIEC